MAGVEGLGPQLAEVGEGPFQVRLRGTLQVEAADDVGHAPLAAHLPGVLDGVAHARVGAAHHHHQALGRDVGQGGVLGHGVRSGLALLPAEGEPALEVIAPGDAREVHEAGGQPLGLGAHLQWKVPGELGLGQQGAALGEGGIAHAGEGLGVRHECRAPEGPLLPLQLGVVADEGLQAPGVVLVAVGEGDAVQLREIDAQLVGVPQEDVGKAGVEEHPRAAGLHEEGEARLRQQVAVDERVVVDEDRQAEGHGVSRRG